MPAGSHVARCYGVISLGTQPTNNPQFNPTTKVMLMFEVPGEPVMVDNKPAPMTISKDYTLSLNEKANLRHDLVSWRGREFTEQELEGFAVEKVIGVPCMLSVVHKKSAKGSIYANIAGIAGLPKGVECPPAWHKPIHYEIEHGENAVFKSLHEWIQKKIAACEEWNSPAAVATQEKAVSDPQNMPPGDDNVPDDEDSRVPF